MYFPRASGILLHPTALPGRFGIGDFGDEAYRFVDFLRDTGQTYWQILPLVATGYGDSPYSSISAFGGNQLLISPEKLVEDGLLPVEVCENAPEFPSGRTDYGGVYGWKNWLLDEAFGALTDSELGEEFQAFKHENSWWLDDFAAFKASKLSHGHRPWFEWPDSLKFRDPEALASIHADLATDIERERFRQFLFYRQWYALRHYANENGIKIIGDIPIFVALDSVDVWCNQDKFKLNEDSSPRVVAGTPPDYFCSTGQRWGNPIYDWEAMREDNFSWWTARISFNMRLTDIIRLDHFIGFGRNWEVPNSDPTAENGKWVEVPGHEVFSAISRQLGDLPVIAEDLGALTPAVEELRDAFGFPGMHILHYAFGGDAHNRDLPHNYVRNCVAYTGTHDNDTTVGWYKSESKHVKDHCKKYLRCSGRDIHWHMICAVFASVADTALIPAQDILGLGRDARFNRPGSTDGNWAWRLKEADLTDHVRETLSDMTTLYGRWRR